MEYTVIVEDDLNDILKQNADKKGVSVGSLISELLKRYVIDANIMEKSEAWQRGIESCADINLDWANL